MSWRKLNHLIPEPQCRTSTALNGTFTISDWTDARTQPTKAEIDAVLEADILVADLQKEEDNFAFPDVMETIAKGLYDLDRRTRALEGQPVITLRQFIKGLRQL